LSGDPREVTFRAPTEADHLRLARLVREWWDERPPRIDRLWFRHFASTSVVGTLADGRPIAVAIAFRSPKVRGHGVLTLVAVAPSDRRRGVGRAAVDAAIERLKESDPTTAVEATVWPGNRAGVRFLEALGFAPDPSSRATPLYGVPAIADYDGEGEDRSLFILSLPGD
jgi:ribosomal protein S18 acetylase RimI-like enzyme